MFIEINLSSLSEKKERAETNINFNIKKKVTTGSRFNIFVYKIKHTFIYRFQQQQ